MPRSPTLPNSPNSKRPRATISIDQRGGAALLAEQPAVGDWVPAIEDHARWIGVAELDGFVVGYLELAVTGDIAVVRQVYVQPEARELGFGDALLDAARQEAQRHGCSALEGFASAGRSRDEEPLRAGRHHRSQDHRLDAAVARAYLACQFGARFSMNAVRPSLVSSDARMPAKPSLVIFFNVSSSS